VMGGDTDSAFPPDPGRLAPALRFSPAGEQGGEYTGTFGPAGTVAARIGVAAAALPDLSVLVVGGARTPLGPDPTVAAGAGDWTQSLDLFVPCGVKNSPCPR